MTEYVNLPFETEEITINQLVIQDAIGFAVAIEDLPFAEFYGTRRRIDDSRAEIILFEVEVERPQKRVHPINRKERFAAVFPRKDGALPEVFALRADFPQAPHQNLGLYEYPRSLCLYEEDPRDVQLHWTPLGFLERIRSWLALTAKGLLHQEDQPLEPLLVNNGGTIVISDEVFNHIDSKDSLPVLVHPVSRDKDPKMMLIAHGLDVSKIEEKPPFVAMGIMGKATTHGIIRHQPATLKQLADLMKDSGFDLISEMRLRLKQWKNGDCSIKFFSESLPILLVGFPKTRNERGSIEETEVWGFACEKNLVNLGIDLGLWEIQNGEIGLNLPIEEERQGGNVPIFPLKPVRSFSRKAAANLSGITQSNDHEMVLVGGGALGSQIFLNAIRSGLGKWTIIDDDRLLPHNLARHSLDALVLGHYKAESLSFIANTMIDGGSIASAIVANVLDPAEKKEAITKAFDGADTIIDASASVSVARYLALDLESKSRRISTFFTPSGGASVLLAEDTGRNVRLDILEMQYYRELISSGQFQNHLTVSGRRIRYAQSCRDLTSRVSQDLVSLHASLCSNAIKKVLTVEDAFAGIWSIQSDLHDVGFTKISTPPLIKMNGKKWQIRTDQSFLSKLARLRSERLPNETGGIILGAHDMSRQIIYLIDTIPSPPDSLEWPTVYIRGCKGLSDQLKKVESRTAGNLVYVGEWHSHPDGVSILPSRDDMDAFSWLRAHMQQAGLPPLMVIQGRGKHYGIYVEVMD